MITEIIASAMLTIGTATHGVPSLPEGSAVAGRELRYKTEEEERVLKSRRQRRAEASMRRRGINVQTRKV